MSGTAGRRRAPVFSVVCYFLAFILFWGAADFWSRDEGEERFLWDDFGLCALALVVLGVVWQLVHDRLPRGVGSRVRQDRGPRES
ncbi:MAG: hypothetical protein ACRDPK_12075 [Carbonactinosporaceae bacterium]